MWENEWRNLYIGNFVSSVSEWEKGVDYKATTKSYFTIKDDKRKTKMDITKNLFSSIKRV